VATDADSAGDQYYQLLLATRDKAQIQVDIQRHRPECNDWNEVLKQSNLLFHVAQV
jgi:hypothetical protein